VTREDLLSLATEFRAVLVRLPKKPKDLFGIRARRTRLELEKIADELQARLAVLDPTHYPSSFFDPADPRLFGVFAALALVGQKREPMASVATNKFYGSGVYAIYYSGNFSTYLPISGTENPIYVGKADPATPNARTPRAQGHGLCGRLNDHRKNIDGAANLRLADFECRYLVVATGWQSAAESALIGLFRPLWNKETGILLGIGKHGDAAETRRHPRSPWDVLHAGRKWATSKRVKDRKSSREIKAAVRGHFAAHAPVADIKHVVRELTAQIRTRPPN
jgi:hypothetical protein